MPGATEPFASNSQSLASTSANPRVYSAEFLSASSELPKERSTRVRPTARMRTARRVSTNENPPSPSEVSTPDLLPTVVPMTLRERDATRPGVRRHSIAGATVLRDEDLEPVGAPVRVEGDVGGARRNGNRPGHGSDAPELARDPLELRLW